MENHLELNVKLPDHEFKVSISIPKLATMELAKNYVDDILGAITDAFEEKMDDIRSEMFEAQEALIEKAKADLKAKVK